MPQIQKKINMSEKTPQRIELIMIDSKDSKPLSQSPPKDGSVTDYKCGVRFIGGWSTRLNEHQQFCESPVGKYILRLEGILNLERL